jgi:hypothetical protein
VKGGVGSGSVVVAEGGGDAVVVGLGSGEAYGEYKNIILKLWPANKHN